MEEEEDLGSGVLEGEGDQKVAGRMAEGQLGEDSYREGRAECLARGEGEP